MATTARPLGYRAFVPTLAATVLVLLLPSATSATSAASAKSPVGYSDTTRLGVGAPDGGAHYYADSYQGRTRVMRFTPDAERQTLTMATLQGTYGVPSVAADSTTDGLSADGGTLILPEPRLTLTRQRTRMVVLDTRKMRKAGMIDLRGDWAFDAISPAGETAYLIHYLDPRRGGLGEEFEVRAYDVPAGRLRGEPVLDSETAPIVMRGFAITRVSTPDGVWSYTLYTGGRVPFVHALNTETGTTACIDIAPAAGQRNVWRLGLALAPDGAGFEVLDRRRGVLASVAAGSWEVSEPSTPDAAAEQPGTTIGMPPLWGFGVGAVGVAFVLAAARRRRAARRGPAELPADSFARSHREPEPAAVARVRDPLG